MKNRKARRRHLQWVPQKSHRPGEPNSVKLIRERLIAAGKIQPQKEERK